MLRPLTNERPRDLSLVARRHDEAGACHPPGFTLSSDDKNLDARGVSVSEGAMAFTRICGAEFSSQSCAPILPQSLGHRHQKHEKAFLCCTATVLNITMDRFLRHEEGVEPHAKHRTAPST